MLRITADHARPLTREGRVADYIPALGSADPDAFGIALSELDGTDHVLGDTDEPFPIQSISKVFALTLAMQRLDDDGDDDAEGGEISAELWSRVGREPSGDPFNSLVQLEHEEGIPRNPFINSGSLIVVDVLLDHCADAREEMTELVSDLAGQTIKPDMEVLRSEEVTGYRNRAMAMDIYRRARPT